MNSNTITRGAALVASRLPAFVAGSIFVACAAAILFEDVVLNGAPITLQHLLTFGVLSGALLVGHNLVKAWEHGHWFAAFRFAILFSVATGLIVYLSTGKQAEHTFQSQAEADFAAEERTRIRPLLAAAEQMQSDTAKKIKKECVDGKASKTACDGLRATHGVYEAAVNGHKANLDKLGAPKPVAPEAESFANIAAVFGFDKAKVKAGAILVVPFVRTILFELGGLWCLGYAFRPATRATGKTGGNTTIGQAATDAELASLANIMMPDDGADFDGNNDGNSGNRDDGNSPKPGNPGNGGGNKVFSRIEAQRDLLARLATGETIGSQDELAERWGVNKGTVSKWLKVMEEDRLIPARQRIGRCHRLVAAD